MAVAGVALGCDVGTPVLADEKGGPAPHVVWSYPQNEATGVPPTQSIRVQFDRFLLPLTAVRQGICVQAATVGKDTDLDQCFGNLAPQYDPVDRVAIWKPLQPLLPFTRYNVRLLAPQDDNDVTGIRAFDRAPLTQEITFAFTTGDSQAEAVEPKRDVPFCFTPAKLCGLPHDICSGPSPTTAGLAFGPSPFLHSTCAQGTVSCHGSGGDNGPPGGFLQLDDPDGGTPAAIRRLIGETSKGVPVVARASAGGATPTLPRRSINDPFGLDMPYIDPNNPGNSYLLYTLILALPGRCPYDPTEESAHPAPLTCTDAGGYASPSGFPTDLYDCPDIADAEASVDPATLACSSDAGAPPPEKKVGEAGSLVPPIAEPWVPADQWKPPARGEYDRLRLVIRTDGMPPGALSRRQDSIDISAWIAAGAHVETCDPLAE